MRLRVGTWPWLLAHELRLTVRGFGSGASALMIVLGVVWVAAHLPAWVLMSRFSVASLDGTGFEIVAIAAWFALTLMLSAAILLSVNALYDRGDLDLLMSSPVGARTVFVVRGLGVALGSVALFAAIVLPMVHMGAAVGQWRLLAAYPVLASLALGAAALGFALTLLLVRGLGARRARVVAQVLSAIIGALLFLGVQLPNILPEGAFDSLGEGANRLEMLRWFGADSLLSWPARALLGDPVPAFAVICVGAGLFFAVTRMTSQAFLSGTQESGRKSASVRREPAARRAFRPGVARNVIRKELLLIARDPNLIAQTLLQTLYLLPLVFVLGRNVELTFILAPVFVVICAQIAGNLAWITVCGEDAPDLLGTAPVKREAVLWLKAAAAVLPVAVLAVPLAWFYVLRSPVLALVFVLFLFLALASAATIQVWGGKPAARRDLKQRHKQNVSLNLVETLSTVGIAGGCYLAMTGSVWALAALGVGAIGPWFAWSSRRAS